jgi:adenosylcobinamide-GDP ribazoletransferase
MNAHAITRGMREQLNSFLGAVVFLTRIPVGSLYDFQREELSRSLIYFPIVGMIVGLAGGLVLIAGHLFLPSLIAVLLCMAATVVVTGGIHEDGLADAADGLFGGRDAARCLEIMKDSRLGTFGALALWFSLTGKLLLLTSLLERNEWLAFAALVMANTLGRGACVVLLYFYPYVRAEGSRAKLFGDGVGRGQLVLALVFSAALAFALTDLAAASCVLAAILVTALAGIYFKRKIGGVTGDCLGAANQFVELACYLALAAQLRLTNA